MESNRFFVVVQRINSVLFLLLLLGGLGLMAFGFYESSRWEHNNQVVVAPQADGESDVELFVGDLEGVSGHDVQYVELQARERGGKFSSGGYGAETRNLLFLRGSEMSSAWLFEGNQQLISEHRALTREGSRSDDNEPVIALYYEVVRGDSDGDGRMDADDGSTIALSRPDGTGYREIESGVRRVVQQRVVDEGATLLLLVQEASRVMAKRYSLRTFEKISEKEIASLAHAPE